MENFSFKNGIAKNLLLSVVLLILFVGVWYYNQRLYYRKFLTLDTKFFLKANYEPRAELSSVVEIYDVLTRLTDKQVLLTSKIEGKDKYGALGRVISIEGLGTVEIYEFENNKKASKPMRSKTDNDNTMFVYKNLLINTNLQGINLYEVLLQK